MSVQVPDVDASVSVPDVSASIPEAGVSIPEASVSMPEASVSMPAVSGGIEGAVPSVDADLSIPSVDLPGRLTAWTGAVCVGFLSGASWVSFWGVLVFGCVVCAGLSRCTSFARNCCGGVFVFVVVTVSYVSVPLASPTCGAGIAPLVTDRHTQPFPFV